jgi:hypothetical protein
MKIRSCVPLILLVSSAAACAPAARPAAPAPRADDVPPVLSLVSERERLSLTPDQVVQLEAIARDWDKANTRLGRQRAAGSKLPVAALPLLPEAGALRKAMAENNARAARSVEKVLTADQRAAACRPAADPRLRTASLRAEPAAARTAWHWCRG